MGANLLHHFLDHFVISSIGEANQDCQENQKLHLRLVNDTEIEEMFEVKVLCVNLEFPGNGLFADFLKESVTKLRQKSESFFRVCALTWHAGFY